LRVKGGAVATVLAHEVTQALEPFWQNPRYVEAGADQDQTHEAEHEGRQDQQFYLDLSEAQQDYRDEQEEEAENSGDQNGPIPRFFVQETAVVVRLSVITVDVILVGAAVIVIS
jgi:hypothetical protein